MPTSPSLNVLRLSREGSLSLSRATPSLRNPSSMDLSAEDGKEAWELSLVPDVFRRVVAPAQADPAGREASRPVPAPGVPVPSPGFDPHALFALKAGGDDDAVAVSRAELRAFLERERPQEIARALRIADDERRDPAAGSMSPQQRADDFERRWNADSSAGRLDAVLARAPYPVPRGLDASGMVAVWVNRDDLGAIQGRGEASAWMASGVRQPEYAGPEGSWLHAAGAATGRVLEGLEGAEHLAEGFGKAGARRLHLDPRVLARGLAQMGPEAAEAALHGLAGVLERGGSARWADMEAMEAGGVRSEGQGSHAGRGRTDEASLGR